MNDSSGLPTWLMSEYRHFVEVVSREDFPCHFGTVAQLHGELRYSFVEGQDVSRVPATLEKFLELSRARPQAKHNLTLFFEPEHEEKSFEYYRDRMWEILGYLHRHDRASWPSSIPQDPDEPAWEFCFGGEPFFLFAGSPAYKRRKSRNYGSSFILLFQPKRVFQGLDNDSPAGIKARRAIRGRLQVWDGITRFHPDMHDFGQTVGDRWKQYMFSDDDTAAVGGCPFAQVPTSERKPLANENR